jgi:hypothetical protein
VDPISAKLGQLLLAQEEQVAHASSLQNITAEGLVSADKKLEQVMALQNRTLGRMLLIQGEHERALLAQERKLDRLLAAQNMTSGALGQGQLQELLLVMLGTGGHGGGEDMNKSGFQECEAGFENKSCNRVGRSTNKTLGLAYYIREHYALEVSGIAAASSNTNHFFYAGGAEEAKQHPVLRHGETFQ